MSTNTQNLRTVRGDLIRLEETIIFALIERAQFSRNSIIYKKEGGIDIPGFSGSYVDFLLHGTECLHSRVRRYTSPDEFPFFDDLPQPILKSGPGAGKDGASKVLNYNTRIKAVYEKEIVPLICKAGDDAQYGSSAVCDVQCLQAISKRVHYGIFVARSKFNSRRNLFEPLIAGKDRKGIYEQITDGETEEKLLRRVEHKATTYGQDIEGPKDEYKIEPSLIREIYARWLIPLTREVQVEYLLKGSPLS
jgi:chorismate mutase